MRAIKHGTYSGSLAHYRIGEKPCEDCRQARNDYMRDRRPKVEKVIDPIISTVPAGRGHGVYVIFDRADEVLYIGRSQDIRRRLTNHRNVQPWWPQAIRVEWTPCDGVHEARAVEKSMIRTFRPEANVNDVQPLTPSARQTLPDWAAANLIRLYEDVVATGQRHTPEDDIFNGYIAALRRNGWTLAAIGYAVGMTREAIRLRQAQATSMYDKPGVPSIPTKAARVKKVKPKIPMSAMRELRELQAKAVTVRGWTPLDAPERAASELYSERLADWHLQGVSIYQIAKQMGVTHLAIRARLARHGYMGDVKGLDQPKYGTPWVRDLEKCKAGHLLSGENLRLIGGDPRRRVCKACDRRRGREYNGRRLETGRASEGQVIRHWAQQSGLTIAATGPIPAHIRSAYDASVQAGAA